MFASVISRILVILLLSGSHTAAVGQPDEPVTVAQTVSAKATLAPSNIPPQKLPLDVRLAHWASMALVGFAAVSSAHDLYQIVRNTKRHEALEGSEHAAHSSLKPPYAIIESKECSKLVSLTEPEFDLELYLPDTKWYYQVSVTDANTIKTAIQQRGANLWKDANVSIDECVSELARTQNDRQPDSIQLYIVKTLTDQKLPEVVCIFENKNPLFLSLGKSGFTRFAKCYGKKFTTITTINRRPYMIRAGTARAFTFIASTALTRWMYKNPPAAGPNSTKRAAGFTIAGLGIGAAGVTYHWVTGSDLYIKPLVPLLTAASLLLRGYAEWRCRSSTPKVAAAHK